MDLKEEAYGDKWVKLPQDGDKKWALVNTVRTIGSINCREFLD
jgi:hypothetical protein